MKILIQNLELKSIQQISQYTTFCKFSTCFIETRSTLLRNSSFTSLIIQKFNFIHYLMSYQELIKPGIKINNINLKKIYNEN